MNFKDMNDDQLQGYLEEIRLEQQRRRRERVGVVCDQVSEVLDHLAVPDQMEVLAIVSQKVEQAKKLAVKASQAISCPR